MIKEKQATLSVVLEYYGSVSGFPPQAIADGIARVTRTMVIVEEGAVRENKNGICFGKSKKKFSLKNGLPIPRIVHYRGWTLSKESLGFARNIAHFED